MAHYINTNSRNEDPVLYNYSAWSYAIRSLDSFLAVEMFNSYSPPNSPLLVPLGHMPFTTNRFLLTQMEASSPSPLPSSPLPPSSPPVPSEHDSNIENDPRDILLREWEEYNPNNSNHYPVTYTDEFGWQTQACYICYIFDEGIPTVQGCMHPSQGIYGEILHPCPCSNPVSPT